MKEKYPLKSAFALALFFVMILFSSEAEEYSAVIQEKILLPFAEIRSTQTQENYNFGAALFTCGRLKKFPCSLKWGNLSGGGGLSKLNNPALSSSISAFSTAQTDVSPLSAKLPAINTWTKPLSCFLEAGYHDKKRFFSRSQISSFYNGQEDFPVFSVTEEIRAAKKVFLAASMTASSFSYEENTFSSWFTTSDFYYHQGKHLCALPQVSFSSPHFSTLFSLPCYENPFGKINCIWKSESKITAGHFCINISALYNENSPVLTSNENLIKDILQTKAGIISNFSIGRKRPLFLKSGFNSFCQINLSDTSHKVKLAAGSRLTAQKFSISLLSNAAFTCSGNENGSDFSTDLDSLSFQFFTGLHFSKISPSFAYSLSFYPKNDYESLKTSQKIACKLAFFRNPKINLAASYTFTRQDDELLSRTFTASMNVLWKMKYLSLTGKIGIQLE